MPPDGSVKEEVKSRYNSIKTFEKTDKYYVKRRAEQLLHFFDNSPKNSFILNLGCGDGTFSDFLKLHGSSNIIDLDISVKLIGQSKCNRRILGDAENLPFRKEIFDAVIMTDVIEHIENRKKAISEISRALKKSGRVFITYPNPFWVSLFNFFGRIGLKMDSRDNKLPPAEFEKEFSGLFENNSFKTIMIASKLPSWMLSAIERIEMKIPQYLISRFGFMHVYIIKKRFQKNQRRTGI